MNKLYELKEELIEKLGNYKGKDMSGSNLEMVDTLAHAAKNICKILEGMDDYSGRGMSYRDNRGRYSRNYDSSYDRSYDGRMYSRDGGMVDELTELMHNAPEHMKGDFRKLISKIETM